MKQLIFYFIFLNKRDSGGHSFEANLDDHFFFVPDFLLPVNRLEMKITILSEVLRSHWQ